LSASGEGAPEGVHLRQHGTWSDNIEALVMAVAMALFLKYFVIEAYKIPTGSMQPTLIGDDRADIKDRILVDKLSYFFRAPRRWEVAVFDYPLERSKSFVKRIAGVGPEEFRILHGDLWQRTEGEDWHILRRPPEVQAGAWKRLDAEDPEQSRWIAQGLPDASHWRTEGRSIQARGDGTAAFRGGRESIIDEYFDGYPEELVRWLPAHPQGSGENAVGDLRVEGEVRALPGSRLFTLVLREGRRRYRFEIPGPAAETNARTRITDGALADGGALEVELEYRLPDDSTVRFAAQNLDDRLTLEIEGEEVLSMEVEPAEDQFSSVVLVLEGEGADLDDLMVYRDTYYTGGRGPIRIPAGHYFMLGDNTQDSSDSREWNHAVYDVNRSDGDPVRIRGGFREGQNPVTVGFGDPDGPRTHLVDEWGEKHWFRLDAARRRVPEYAPFVPRALIHGKALAVFWPLDPIRGIWRLKWVN
jgi:hypothetical protein